jgi:superfamily II DNA/RNA helicase
MDFESLGLHSALLGALARLEHTVPTAVQNKAIPAALAGQDLLVSSHTGSGKTGAFLLPCLHRLANDPGERRPRVLVLTPTRELALQIERAARDYAAELRATGRRLRTACLIGGAPFGPQLQALSDGSELLIATPGRMLDHLERGRLDLSMVHTLVLDEADRMLDMGFIDDIDLIASRLPPQRQTMLFSATLDGRVAPVARRLTRDPQRIELSAKIDHDMLTEVVHHADDLDHKNRLLDAILASDGLAQAIVFMSTKISTEEQAARLRDGGHAVAALHGDLPQHARNRVVRAMLEGRIQVLIATDVAARGIDVPSISHVINFDLPMKAEDYVHRIGRTARAGRNGTSVSFAGRADRSRLFGIERMLGRALPVATMPGLEPRFAPPRRDARDSRGAGRSDGRRPGGFGARTGGWGAPSPGYGRSEGGRDRAPAFAHDRSGGAEPRFDGNRSAGERGFTDRSFADRAPAQRPFAGRPAAGFARPFDVERRPGGATAGRTAHAEPVRHADRPFARAPQGRSDRAPASGFDRPAERPAGRMMGRPFGAERGAVARAPVVRRARAA